MIEQLLEDRIIQAVESLGLEGISTIGSWSVPTDETPMTAATLTVVVGPRSYARYTVCEATFPVTLNLAVAAAVDGDGSLFARAATAVSDMLHVWNMNRHNEAKTALGVDGALSIGGIRVEGGEAPYFDRETARRTFSISFSVVGFVAHDITTTNED